MHNEIYIEDKDLYLPSTDTLNYKLVTESSIHNLLGLPDWNSRSAHSILF